MQCCEKCFDDRVICELIRSKNVKGKCDFCGSKPVYVYELDTDDTIYNYIASIVDIYHTGNGNSIGATLEHYLAKEWNIFNSRHMPQWRIRQFLDVLFQENDANYDKLTKKVVLLESTNKAYLEHYSIFRNANWDKFAECIKICNRFHVNDCINLSVLEGFLSVATKFYKCGNSFYRSRKERKGNNFTKEDLNAPPFEKTTEGRVSSKGIKCLYVSDCIETTIYEIRAHKYDNIAIGTFELVKDVKVVDLSALPKLSPFEVGEDMSMYAVNRQHLQKISKEISEPINPEDDISVLDYLPSQYIAYYIKSLGYDGVEFKSAIRHNGYNVAFFDPQLLTCTHMQRKRVSSLQYRYKTLN